MRQCLPERGCVTKCSLQEAANLISEVVWDVQHLILMSFSSPKAAFLYHLTGCAVRWGRVTLDPTRKKNKHKDPISKKNKYGAFPHCFFPLHHIQWIKHWCILWDDAGRNKGPHSSTLISKAFSSTEMSQFGREKVETSIFRPFLCFRT